MEIQEYLDKLKKIHNCTLEFIESDEDTEEKYHNLINMIENHNLKNNQTDFKIFLNILSKISDNHHRTPDLFNKIERIIKLLKPEIMKYYTNFEIFKNFKNNKKILLFLLEEKIFTIDKSLLCEMNKPSYQERRYIEYFQPEIKRKFEYQEKNENFIDVKDDKYHEIMKIINMKLPKDFEKKRIEGENDDIVCEMIRNDSIEDFITYVNKENYTLNCDVKSSIYETNIFIIKNHPTLIEYAAFYGSVQIFKYLYKNGVELKDTLWYYAIHSNNPEMINLLEENKVDIEQYESCLEESIKCHHNEAADYIQRNYLNECNLIDNIQSYCFHYYNYSCLYYDTINDNIFLCACTFNYFDLVKLFLNTININIDTINQKALKLAGSRNNNEILKLLFEQKEIQISTDCFKDCFKLIEVSIPSCVKTIGKNAFQNCFCLKKITIPSTVTSIEGNAFACCSSLSEIEIPSTVNVIGENAFYECTSLKEITIPSCLTSISANTFNGCTLLSKIEIPSSVTLIFRGAFKRCSSLPRIEIPSYVTSIESSVFEECYSLQEISILCFITSINDNLFSKCSSLKEIKIPSSVNKIKHFAFRGCSSLTELIIPSSVKSIGNYCFCDCSSLVKISLPDTLKSIGERAFTDCISLIDVKIPSSLSVLKNNIFYNCSSLQHIKIPNTIVEIENFAFCDCKSLKEIIVPPSVKKIGSQAFGGCQSLIEMTIPNTVNELGPGVFFESNSLRKVRIPLSISQTNFGLNLNVHIIRT